MDSFYSSEELKQMGFSSIGCDVLISRNAQIYGAENIHIGNHVRVDDFCILSGKIILHNYIHISAYTALYGKYGIEIYDYCGCSPKSIIFSATDDFSGENMISPMVPEKLTNIVSGKVTLHPLVQLGANTIVMPNVDLFEGSATAAFSFVNKNLESFYIYGGIPCKKIKQRKRNIVELSKTIGEV